jgi:hypothetical protein
MQGATARARDLLIERVGEAETVGEIFRIASERLRRVVPFDASVWMSTDPATGLPTAPSRAENLGHVGGADVCARAWELEFFASDVNLFGDLAPASAPAGALRLATGDDPSRSTRCRALLGPHGFADELRAVLVADGSPWGLVTLLRAEGVAPFASPEIGLLADLSRPLAEAVREHARSARAPAVTRAVPVCWSSTATAISSRATTTRRRGSRSSRGSMAGTRSACRCPPSPSAP